MEAVKDLVGVKAMNDRKQELIEYIGDRTLEPLIDDFVFIERQLAELKKLPFIRVHPKDPSRQKTTPAAKQYKELLQQYTNIAKILLRVSGADEADQESPLRKWINERLKDE